ncbi:rod shape-determining protein MreD [Poseidonocella sedimentorum]|uniref:Rod shape-determining protein MreD n=1 Tax=Poseidonocella sedimentorum TaxID=871652 RepID=A0A1I6DXX5_9RHOB|nr:rod shape-determining protein MreD [Poseidonocella sedimentorum]SFR10374.1 rod shape-determining protein MreD [Poseidonocella sedimentorum]
MTEAPRAKIWGMRALFLGCAALIVFLHLLPVSTVPRGWAPPDLLLALSFAWVVRRPDYLPALMIAGVFLMADLLYQHPPGLRPLLILLAAEWLRAHAPGFRTAPFSQEWLQCSILLAGITLAYHAALSLFFIDRPGVSLSLIQTAATILAYPFVAAFSHYVLGVRKLVPGDGAAMGRLS